MNPGKDGGEAQGMPAQTLQIALDALNPDPLEALSLAATRLKPWDFLEISENPHAVSLSRGLPIAQLAGIAEILGFQPVGPSRPKDPSHELHLRLARKPIRIYSKRKQSDFEALSKAFFETFKVEMTPALYDWKYGEDRGSALVARNLSGQLLGHYGFISRSIHFEGRSVRALQVCDVFTVPGDRGRLGRNSSFHPLAKLFQILYLASENHAFAYGFPNQRAMAVAETEQIYRKSDQIFQCQWPRSESERRVPKFWTMVPLEDEAFLERAAQSLWPKMRKALRHVLLQERSVTYLRQRYLSHPTHRYRLYVLKNVFPGFSNQALVVIREDSDATRLMDFIGDPRHLATAISTLNQALFLENPEGPPLLAWVTPTVQGYLGSMATRIEETGVFIPVNAFVETSPWSQIRGWWTSFGDTDFL